MAPRGPKGKHSDIGQRVQALALAEYGLAHPESGINGKIAAEIAGISAPSLSTLRAKAKERGYDPSVSTIIKAVYVTDAAKSGRPRAIPRGSQLEQTLKDALAQANRNDREKPAGRIAFEHNLGHGVMLRFLKEEGYKPCKTTKKPGLDEKMMKARLEFCERYKDWTLEDWKNVIWTDETSVVINARRGGRIRIWRKANERFQKECSRVRHKGYSEFMFWGCFSYDNKGPMHCWKAETTKEKLAATKELDRINKVIEPYAKAIWERLQAEKRAKSTRRGGRQAQWKWDEAHGKIVRDSTGGIDWYRYQKCILRPKLIPFAQKCQQERPDTVVMEDGAPAHKHIYNEKIYMDASVLKLLWPGNSPDLNMIEPCWAYMKRLTTTFGAPQSRDEAEKVWKWAWKRLPQTKIQAWIERIPRHIQEVIRLQGDNNYREGRDGGSSSIRPYDKEERRTRYEKNKTGVFRGENFRLYHEELEEFDETATQTTLRPGNLNNHIVVPIPAGAEQEVATALTRGDEEDLQAMMEGLTIQRARRGHAIGGSRGRGSRRGTQGIGGMGVPAIVAHRARIARRTRGNCGGRGTRGSRVGGRSPPTDNRDQLLPQVIWGAGGAAMVRSRDPAISDPGPLASGSPRSAAMMQPGDYIISDPGPLANGGPKHLSPGGPAVDVPGLLSIGSPSDVDTGAPRSQTSGDTTNTTVTATAPRRSARRAAQSEPARRQREGNVLIPPQGSGGGQAEATATTTTPTNNAQVETTPLPSAGRGRGRGRGRARGTGHG